MSSSPYIHGTSEREQRRLVEQADLLRNLLAGNLALHPGEHLLEIGCGVGAVLGQIARAHPEARLSGIDISANQIAAAHLHLEGLGVGGPELRVGDGAQLPWPAGHFDPIRMVWVVEHLADTLAVLREARRVLRPGGSIHLTETDYASLRVSPPDRAIGLLGGLRGPLQPPRRCPRPARAWGRCWSRPASRRWTTGSWGSTTGVPASGLSWNASAPTCCKSSAPNYRRCWRRRRAQRRPKGSARATIASPGSPNATTPA
jgi:SAM-dependent methyltransferase